MRINTHKNRSYEPIRSSRDGFTFSSCLAILGVLLNAITLGAESRPKLAVAGVEPAPVLALKCARQSLGPTGPTLNGPGLQESVNWLGEWRGQSKRKKLAVNLVLQITKAPNGSLTARLTNKAGQNTWEATSVNLDAVQARLGFHKNVKNGGVDGGELVGRMDAASQSMLTRWSRFDPPISVVMKRTSGFSDWASGPASPPGLPLEEMIEVIDTQLADQLESSDMFEIMNEADLKLAIPPCPGNSNEPYDLKQPGTIQQFKKAGLHYLLLTTVEDFNYQVIDQSQGTLARQTENFQAQGSRHSSTVAQIQRNRGRAQAERDTRRIVSISGSSVKTQETSAPQVRKTQNLHLAVRCRLFDATTGAVIDSSTHTYHTNRPYVALAQGQNELLSNDLIQMAAKSVCEWLVVKAGEVVFPIKVLDRSEKEITINRGLAAGLRLGQVYGVYTTGKELRDPVSNEILGREEVTVGRVAINEFHQQFSKARILEDNGITAGAYLRRISY